MSTDPEFTKQALSLPVTEGAIELPHPPYTVHESTGELLKTLKQGFQGVFSLMLLYNSWNPLLFAKLAKPSGS